VKKISERIFNWKVPDTWKKITTIDLHTAGEPLRIILTGFPDLPGKTMLNRRKYMKEHFDYIRSSLMGEPRGHSNMYGCILTPPVSKEADIGVLFLHNAGYSTMCGHGIIAVSTMLLETGVFIKKEPETIIKIDTPAGLVTSFCRVSDGQVTGVYFRNVPSFITAMDQKIKIPKIGEVQYDIAFGGAFYVFVQAEELGLNCVLEEYSLLLKKGLAVKRSIASHHSIHHPLEKDLDFLYGTIFVSPSRTVGVHSRNACIFANGQIDRSPTGTGVSGRLALLFSRGEIEKKQPVIFESIIGTRFTGQVIDTTRCGSVQAVITEIEGAAHITGCHEFLINPEDPLKSGFSFQENIYEN